MIRLAVTIAVAILLVFGSQPAAAAQGEIYILELSAAIGPGVSDLIQKTIQQATDEKAACLVIQLDTPGGLAEAMRDINMAILASRVPIVVYVAPSGARAASAGVMITMAADVAAMAPGTNIGAAHPVGMGGKEIDKTMADKVTNDMVAHARSVAQQRGRNADWVEKAVRESVSVTETEALENNIIDLVATDLDDLISQLDGRQLKDKGTLKLAGAAQKIIEEPLRSKILRAISDPNIAYILLMIGLAGLYFELSHPGAIFPGVIGGISIILAFFALQTLPVNTAGILLIILGIIFFIMEMKITSYGLLSIAGIIALLLGSVMLFDSDDPTLTVSLKVILPTVAAVSAFFVIVAGLVFRAHLSRPRTGAEGLVGEVGQVRQALDPQGKVFVHGELWNASSESPLAVGTQVRVTGVQDLSLTVAPVDPQKRESSDHV